MQRWAALAAAAALATAGASMPATAQDTAGPGRPGFLDLGIYTGGSYTSDWFTTTGDDGERHGWDPAYAPTFGAVAQLWIDPRFGVRLHGVYLPQNVPGEGDLDQSVRVVNSYLYDADLVYRPFVLSTPNTLLQTVYLFVGGGGYTANIGDFESEAASNSCIPNVEWIDDSVCVSTDAEYSTTGMGVVGGGIHLARVTDDIEAFGEFAVHVYDSPAHAYGEGDGEDRITFTPRAVIGLKTSIGRRAPRAPEPVPPPPPPPAPAPPLAPEPVTVTPPAPPTPALETIQTCVLRNDEVVRVTAQLDPATGNITADGAPLTDVFPADSQSAASAQWYVAGEPVSFQGRRYVKFGLPRVLNPGDVRRVGEFQGVPVFSEPIPRPEVIYLPVRQGCEFQPYQLETKTSAVRG